MTISILRPVEPEPRRDMEYLFDCRRHGIFPATYLLNYSIKHTFWRRRQKWWRRLLRI